LGGEQPVPTYITLLRYTQKGAGAIKRSPARLDAARKVAKELGAEIKQFYLVLGRYDAILVSEGPDDDTAARLALTAASEENVTTETLRAFTEAEFRKIVAGLP
jgi:uncharacterized protein with GYD domain